MFCDPVAFRYLEEDPATIVLDRRRRLQGYEIFVVEQWACSRIHPTFVIATFTGDASHSVLVGVLSVPVNEGAWSSRLKIYFKAVSQFHARKKETPLGTIMVTNLSGFPSALTVIAVPDGDVKKHREEFIGNENLKRMGCSGRAGLSLQPPQQSTIAKYHHLYRTSEGVPIYHSVIELVKICQISLTIYGKLQSAYADGLLCDVTEKAINDWWTDIGTYIYNIEPNDGILGPTTVAALIGLLIGATNRLKAAGATVGKDFTDTFALKRAIGWFQKQQKLEPTRRLDRHTIDRLHRVTAKSASNEGWSASKAVKSTVAELSGKGGEMVMGIVGGNKEKSGIADAETLDLDRIAQLAAGARMKWIWQGKPVKTGTEIWTGSTEDPGGKIFSTDDQGNYMWTDKRDSVVESNAMRRMELAEQRSIEGEDKTRVGGRLRDAIGLRHHTKRSLNGHTFAESQRNGQTMGAATPRDHMLQDHGPQSALPTPGINGPPEKPAFDLAPVSSQKNASQQNLSSELIRPRTAEGQAITAREEIAMVLEKQTRREKIELRKVKKEMDDEDNFQDIFDYSGPDHYYLRRSRSAIKLMPVEPDNPRSNRHPRHLSFSAVEDTVLSFEDLSAVQDDLPPTADRPVQAMKGQQALARMAQHKAKDILYLEQQAVNWASTRIDTVEGLDRTAQSHYEELNTMYYQKLEDHQELKAASSGLLTDEKMALTDGLRKVEALGAKLDYELNALESRLDEVYVSLDEFERNVLEIEQRARELATGDERRISWYYWLKKFSGEAN